MRTTYVTYKSGFPKPIVLLICIGFYRNAPNNDYYSYMVTLSHHHYHHHCSVVVVVISGIGVVIVIVSKDLAIEI